MDGLIRAVHKDSAVSFYALALTPYVPDWARAKLDLQTFWGSLEHASLLTYDAVSDSMTVSDKSFLFFFGSG